MSKLDSVGVVVGRFQCAELHAGHMHVVNHVVENHNYMVVVLGSTGGAPDSRNPLPFAVREPMLRNAIVGRRMQIPEFTITELLDHPISPELWSKELDSLIESLFPGKKVVMYGGRDSFLKVYSGKHPTKVLPPVPHISGTESRAKTTVINSPEFRAGLIWLANNRYPIVYPTVDIAVVDTQEQRVMLIGKNREAPFLRLPGGFVDKNDASFKAAALRELSEELPGVVTHTPIFIGSFKSSDRRYRANDGITTALFAAHYISGDPNCGDDADSAQWVSFRDLKNMLVPTHLELGEQVLQKYRA